jgi:hypothetical protein
VSEEYVMSKQRGGSGPMDHKLMQSRLGPQLKIFFGRQASRGTKRLRLELQEPA